MSVHAFVDTNVLLAFFSTSNDDLEELKKMVELIRGGELSLHITTKVQKEWIKNRENKIATSLGDFEKATLNVPIPRFMLDYDEIIEFRNLLDRAKKLRANAAERAKKEAIARSGLADRLVEQLFETAKPVSPTSKQLTAAVLRMQAWEPPGKEGSLGDRLNWEQLLEQVPDGNDLHLVTKDTDFYSALLKESAHPSLAHEWRERKKATLHVHSELKPFLSTYFPQFKFAEDIKKHIAVTRLARSSTYSSTHAAVANLLPLLDTLTSDDKRMLISAACDNSQIFGIGTDMDVQDFYSRLVLPMFDQLDPAQASLFKTAFKIDPHEEDYFHEPDPLMPDYTQVFLDDLDAQRTWEERREAKKTPDIRNEDDPFA